MKISIDKESRNVCEVEGDEVRIIDDMGIIQAKIYQCSDGIYISSNLPAFQYPTLLTMRREENPKHYDADAMED